MTFSCSTTFTSLVAACSLVVALIRFLSEESTPFFFSQPRPLMFSLLALLLSTVLLPSFASNVSMVLLSPAIVVFRRVTVLFNSSIFLLCSSFFTFNKSKSIVEVLVKLVNKSAKAG